MIDHSSANLEKVAVHTVGNQSNGEELHLSKALLDTADARVKELLMQFFMTPFQNPEFYAFTFSNGDFKMNPLFSYATQVFESSKTLHKHSVNIAKHLFELSTHPQIKSGDLFVAYFTDVTLEDEMTEVLGIFKSENRQSFLKLESGKEDFSINYDDGINTEKLDKGCLIFNTDKDTGYKVCIIDKSNKSEAQYWRDSFLQLKPCSDDYHHTKDFMNIAKNYVTKQLTEEFEVSRADQIDLLNRSVEYFKTNDTFEKKDFEKKVLQDNAVIKSFRNYDQEYRSAHDIEDNDTFEISAPAVKKQSRIFKSVLKLDKNFHIYIHGDRDKIEKGVDERGRKFYKIYFDQEF